jgi:hypothetical protein
MKLANLNPLEARQLSCSGLVQGAVINCDDPLTPGIRKRLIGFNLADILTVTYDVAKKNVIKSIVLKPGGKAAFVFEGIKQSITPTQELRPQTTSNGWQHGILMSIFDVSSEQKINIQGMANKSTVWVVENANDSSNSDSIFEVYGLGRGLEAETITRSPTDTESGAAYVIQLQTPAEGGSEVVPVESWFDTDYATTLAAVETLLTPTI